MSFLPLVVVVVVVVVLVVVVVALPPLPSVVEGEVRGYRDHPAAHPLLPQTHAGDIIKIIIIIIIILIIIIIIIIITLCIPS